LCWRLFFTGFCGSKSSVSFPSPVIFQPGSLPSFTVSVRDQFGDPFTCSVNDGCAVGGTLQPSKRSTWAVSYTPRVTPAIPLTSVPSGCCSAVLGVSQQSFEDGIFNISFFISRGDMFTSAQTLELCGL
jgi:hypothetical protein